MATLQPMSVGFYAFYLSMWVQRKITEAELLLKVPRFLTQLEFEAIIATPQIPE